MKLLDGWVHTSMQQDKVCMTMVFDDGSKQLHRASQSKHQAKTYISQMVSKISQICWDWSQKHLNCFASQRVISQSEPQSCWSMQLPFSFKKYSERNNSHIRIVCMRETGKIGGPKTYVAQPGIVFGTGYRFLSDIAILNTHASFPTWFPHIKSPKSPESAWSWSPAKAPYDKQRE